MPFDGPSYAGGPADGGLAEPVHTVLEAALATLQAWLADERLASSRLVVVTRGAVSTGSEEAVGDLTCAALWGLVRSAQAENPGVWCWSTPMVRCWRVCGPRWRSVSRRWRCAAVSRACRAWCAPLPATCSSPAAPGWRLDTRAAGTLENLALLPYPEAVAPLAAGRSGWRCRPRAELPRRAHRPRRLPGAAVMGGEGAGIVTEVGPEVTGLAVGDRVMGLLHGAFGPLVVADARMVVPLPADWSFARGASIGTVFGTAWYGLAELAGLRSGESVLVHAGAGGVGMAAIQLARAWVWRSSRRRVRASGMCCGVGSG
ncbi:alcohol dehydrogenase catalytic domain-containing protein [Streptomyces sp. M19]